MDAGRELSRFGLAGHPGEEIVVRTYYFDLRDGVPVRDRQGLEFSSPGAAIAHSKDLARTLRIERTIRDRRLTIAVLDESGAEIHREPVYPNDQTSDHNADRPA